MQRGEAIQRCEIVAVRLIQDLVAASVEVGLLDLAEPGQLEQCSKCLESKMKRWPHIRK